MQRIVAQPPYRVLQRDEAAHVVWDAVGRRWGCVFFQPHKGISQAVAEETLQVKAVNRPCLLMTEATNDGQLNVSVADPDLNQQPGGVSRPQTLHVTLYGKWRLQEAKGTICVWPVADTKNKVQVVSSSDAETTVEIVCQHGASYDLKLVR